MHKISEALKGLPRDVVWWIAEQYDALPEPARAKLEQVLTGLLGSSNSAVRVFRRVCKLAQNAFDQSNVHVA
ncbi:MAG: hypothetical protein ACP5R4_11475, partial [Armatimonadota bacterium]